MKRYQTKLFRGSVAVSGAERGSGEDVRSESEPIEVVQDCCFEFSSRPLAVVVLDSEQDPGAEEPRGTPDVFGVEDVAEVKVAGRSGRESGSHASARFWPPAWSWAETVSRVTDLPCQLISEM